MKNMLPSTTKPEGEQDVSSVQTGTSQEEGSHLVPYYAITDEPDLWTKKRRYEVYCKIYNKEHELYKNGLNKKPEFVPVSDEIKCKLIRTESPVFNTYDKINPPILSIVNLSFNEQYTREIALTKKNKFQSTPLVSPNQSSNDCTSRKKIIHKMNDSGSSKDAIKTLPKEALIGLYKKVTPFSSKETQDSVSIINVSFPDSAQCKTPQVEHTNKCKTSGNIRDQKIKNALERKNTLKKKNTQEIKKTDSQAVQEIKEININSLHPGRETSTNLFPTILENREQDIDYDVGDDSSDDGSDDNGNDDAPFKPQHEPPTISHI